MAKAYFAAGCFWGVEVAFRKIEGVTTTSVGYMGGNSEHPTYEQVCSGASGHAEAVEVTFDPGRVSYERLLEVFWGCHDPTQVNRQGPDIGTQYRTAVFHDGEEQAATAEASKTALAERIKRPVATEITPAGPYWQAEGYHQQYLEKRARKGLGWG